MPNTIWHSVLWFIRSYYDMQQEVSDIILSTPNREEGMPGGGQVPKEVEVKVERMEDLTRKIMIIEESLDVVPEEYRKGVWDNIQTRSPYPPYADRNTYGHWKARYVWTVARRIDLI